MKIERIAKYGSFASNMFFVSDGKLGVIIDPSLDFSTLCERVARTDICVTHCLLTHAHFDHFLAIDDILSMTGATLCVGRNDALALSDARTNCYWQFLGKDMGYRGEYQALSEGDRLTVGDLTIVVYETPGHTRGSLVFQIGNALFVGDLIFAGGGYGRCDLPGGDFEVLVRSIERVCAFPPDTVVYPGHGEPFYLSQYKPFY